VAAKNVKSASHGLKTSEKKLLFKSSALMIYPLTCCVTMMVSDQHHKDCCSLSHHPVTLQLFNNQRHSVVIQADHVYDVVKTFNWKIWNATGRHSNLQLQPQCLLKKENL
jgi:hypothetical protein